MNFFKEQLNPEEPEKFFKLNPVRKYRRKGMIYIVMLIAGLIALNFGGLGLHAVFPASPHHNHNIIYLENQKLGTTRWQSRELNNIRIQNRVGSPDKNDDAISDRGSPRVASAWTDTSIRGYTNATSINLGG